MRPQHGAPNNQPYPPQEKQRTEAPAPQHRPPPDQHTPKTQPHIPSQDSPHHMSHNQDKNLNILRKKRALKMK